MTTNLSKKKSVPIPKDIIYQVSSLNKMVQNLLENIFLALRVEGEVSNFTCPFSGHWYFSLKDSNAQVRCVLFHGNRRYKDLQPRNGTRIIVSAKISLYPNRGEFQLIVEHFELGGEGTLRKTFEELKIKLAAEGLFEDRHKKNLPKFPTSIGIITSESGAVLRDICTVLKRRFPSIDIKIYPCLVQGKIAAKQIVNQIERANQRKECQVLILARGGGSLEDLCCFNEEIVARAIFKSQLPLISAIGHETDFTIADFVADHRAGTPSIAAELASPDMKEYQTLLTKLIQRLTNAVNYPINLYKQRIENLAKRSLYISQQLEHKTQFLDELELRLIVNIKSKFEIQQQKLLGLSRALQAFNPATNLVRGYAILKKTDTKQIVRDVNEVSIGEPVIIEMAKGKLLCEIKKILY